MRISEAQSAQLKIHKEVTRTERIYREHLHDQQLEKIKKIDTEEKRIEANRRMNRAGQNVDRMA
jgi:hypothetical protein